MVVPEEKAAPGAVVGGETPKLGGETEERSSTLLAARVGAMPGATAWVRRRREEKVLIAVWRLETCIHPCASGLGGDGGAREICTCQVCDDPDGVDRAEGKR